MLALLAGLLVAADVGARSVAESQIRDRVVIAAGPAGETAARITSFPFLLRLFTAGDVSRIRVSAADVTVEGLTLARVALDLHGVTLDRDRLLSEQKVVLTALDRGTATAELTAAQLSERLGVAVTLESGRARVRIAGQTVTATASISDNRLRLTVAGVNVPTLRIPRLPLLPCVADAEILPGRIRMTCSVDQIPAELVGRPLDEVVG
ncbi:MAG: LmeA family phospholipid-binding protein [Acidimicrobiales bacterium]|nr:LmeA family phospholipid-binding protein [Acidimicrobiales bacterium]